MHVTARSWAEISPLDLTLDAIRAMHSPASHYAIRPNRYDAGVAVSGRSMAGRLYVLEGSCSRTVGPWTAMLRKGMFVDYSAGAYEFKVLGMSEVRLVNVWLLPERLWAADDR